MKTLTEYIAWAQQNPNVKIHNLAWKDYLAADRWCDAICIHAGEQFSMATPGTMLIVLRSLESTLGPDVRQQIQETFEQLTADEE